MHHKGVNGPSSHKTYTDESEVFTVFFLKLIVDETDCKNCTSFGTGRDF
jgi:hypothetical protein